MPNSKTSTVLEKFKNVKCVGNGWMASCPVHDDQTPSLSITRDEDKILLKCHAGCETKEVLDAVGLKWKDLFLDNNSKRKLVALYNYVDEKGKLLFQALRYEPKSFRVRHPDGDGGWIDNITGVRRVPYRLPELLASEWCLITEGEKDADTAEEMDLPATCNPFGAGKWEPIYNEHFRGKRVYIIADNDQPGERHAQQVASALFPVASSVKILHLSKGKDFADWVELGGTQRELLRLLKRTIKVTAADVAHYGILSAQPKDGVRAERNMHFQTAAEIEATTPATVDWIVRPWIAAGSITELDAKVKLGKTTWMTHLIAKVLDGAPFLGEPTKKTAVVYLTEQPPSSFRETLQRAHLLGRSDLAVLFWQETLGVTWPDVVRSAAEQCSARGAGLLIIDTIAQFARLHGDAENNAGDALATMEPLQQAAAGGLGIVIIRHERKSGGDVGDSGRGSSAFAGAVDTIISLRRPEGNTRPTLRLIEALSRFSEVPDGLVIELTDDGFVSHGSMENVATEEATRMILAELPESPDEAKKLEELTKVTGVARATAQRVIKLLLEKARISRKGAGKRNDPFRFWVSKNLSAQTHTPEGREENVASNSRVISFPENQLGTPKTSEKMRRASEVLARRLAGRN